MSIEIVKPEEGFITIPAAADYYRPNLQVDSGPTYAAIAKALELNLPNLHYSLLPLGAALTTLKKLIPHNGKKIMVVKKRKHKLTYFPVIVHIPDVDDRLSYLSLVKTDGEQEYATWLPEETDIELTALLPPDTALFEVGR